MDIRNAVKRLLLSVVYLELGRAIELSMVLLNLLPAVLRLLRLMVQTTTRTPGSRTFLTLVLSL
jgi:hypothetical protein